LLRKRAWSSKSYLKKLGGEGNYLWIEGDSLLNFFGGGRAGLKKMYSKHQNRVFCSKKHCKTRFVVRISVMKMKQKIGMCTDVFAFRG
jgi:hypothetical protein